MDSHDRSIEEEVADVRMKRPHVVVLGAGASRAACPNGDKHGKRLPLMADFADCVGLTALLRAWGFDPARNFEDIYSALHEAGDQPKLNQLNKAVETYFNALELPDEPNLYDHLVLSLRGDDIIATFNWDPLLLQAYLRTSRRLAGRLSMPRLAFLHGNLGAAYCEADRVMGLVGGTCRHCGKPFAPTPLLYPVRNKDYAASPAIASQWELLKFGFRNSFMITIFGYSGPKTDKEAISAMSQAWGSPHERAMEQTAFITRQSGDEISDAWDNFIHTHHYEVQSDFYESWIANHPRRTGEAYLSQYIDAKFITDNPIPIKAGFDDLDLWFDKFGPAEDLAKAGI